MAQNNENDVSKLVAALTVTNEAAGVYKRHVLFKTIGIILIFVCAFLLTAMMSLNLATEEGIFTAKISDPAPEVRLSLYSNRELTDPTSHLSFGEHGVLDNIAEDDLPEDIDDIDGEHSGLDYLCYTFYLQNVGTGIVDVTAQINVNNVEKGADEALWLKLYQNGVPEVYAKKAKNGEPEPGTKSWIDDKTVYHNVLTLKPEDIMKYTIVVWLEGNDPECIDDICGGFIKLDMAFEGQPHADK